MWTAQPLRLSELLDGELLAERDTQVTLYLVFSEPELVSLDDWVCV